MIRPSSLPALSQCPCFESGSSEYADGGTMRHNGLSGLLQNPPDESELFFLPEEDQDGVRWAANYIKQHAPSQYPIQSEVRGSFIDADFAWVPGTRDVVAGPHLFDLKWRRRDYSAQMAAYVLMDDEHEEITVHVLYGESMHYDRYKITKDAALAIVDPIIAKAKDPERKPTPCEYCSMCALRLTCKAHIERAQAVVQGREDWPIAVKQFHATQITTPEEMAQLLEWAEYLERWAKGIKWRAVQMWEKEGVAIPGCKLKENRGKKFITDMQAAFESSGLPLDRFLKCLKANWKDLESLYTELNKGPRTKKATVAELTKKLEPYISRPKSKFTVVTIKNQEEGEEDNA
jgi:hypothetical protein